MKNLPRCRIYQIESDEKDTLDSRQLRIRRKILDERITNEKEREREKKKKT